MPAPSVKIKVDLKNVPKFLNKVKRKQIPFATAQAITKTLKIAQAGVLKQLDKDIDRPTPFTRRGIAIEPAKKSTLTGRLFIRPIQARYLGLQIFGGTRRAKGTALTIRPAKRIAGGVRLNRFGNVPVSQQARALLSKGAISATIGGVPGIWKLPVKTKSGKTRKGSRLKLMLAYEPQARYKPRFRFFERGQNEIRVNFPRQFQRSFRRALKTAR